MNTGFMKPLKPPKELLSMSTPFSEMVKFVLGDTGIRIDIYCVHKN